MITALNGSSRPPARLIRTRLQLVLVAATMAGLSASRASDFIFRDAGDDAGLFPWIAGIQGHGAAWGDVDGDGFLDLYAGTFHKEGAKPNLFFRNLNGKFQLDGQQSLRISSRTTGVVFADLDNDGDPDLYVASMPQPAKGLTGCTLYRNDGKGAFTDVSKENGACPAAFGGRSATVLDFDGDGLLDILAGEDPMPGYNGSPTKSSRLFRNKGALQFDDVSRAAGLPADVPGYGVAAADVNNDGWPDFFLVSSKGNVLFLNDGRGRFREAPGSRDVFAWKDASGDNMVCGVCCGDVNRDGLPDVVIGQHFDAPWRAPVANRLYLHRGVKDGVPAYEDITEAAGLVPLPIKAPHVEIQDFDNDGWPDISASVVKFAGGRPHPVIFKHLGPGKGGLPRFHADALAVNDFPTEADRSIKRSGDFFKKVLADHRIIYTAPGPAGDYDNDGRLDFFLPNWWPEARSLLLHNETPGGHWLAVRIEGAGGLNRSGIGAVVKVYPAGQSHDAAALLGCQEISAASGYASGHAAMAHFGLGGEAMVDLEVILPHGKGAVRRNGIKANQRLTLQMNP